MTENEMLLIQSKVKEYVKGVTPDHPFHVAEEFVTALNTEVKSLISRAVARCKANGRSTLKSQDV